MRLNLRLEMEDIIRYILLYISKPRAWCSNYLQRFVARNQLRSQHEHNQTRLGPAGLGGVARRGRSLTAEQKYPPHVRLSVVFTEFKLLPRGA